MKHPAMKTLQTFLYVLVASLLLAVGAKAQSNLLVAGDFEGINNPLPPYAATVPSIRA